MYLYYDQDGNITSISNKQSETELYTKVDEKIYNEFLSGQKEMFQYKIIEDLKIKGKMHVVPIDFDQLDLLEQKEGIIIKQKEAEEGLQFLQKQTHWVIKNKLDSATSTLLSQTDKLQNYYVVDSKNRFILFDVITINLASIATNNETVIEGHCADKDVSLLTHSTYFKHIHTVVEN